MYVGNNDIKISAPNFILLDFLKALTNNLRLSAGKD